MPDFQVKFDAFYDANTAEEAAQMFADEYLKADPKTIYVVEVRDYDKREDYREVRVQCAATST